MKQYLVLLFTIFSTLFFYKEEYLFALITLGLLLISARIHDLKSLSLNREGLSAKLNKADKELPKILRSRKSPKKKLKASQQLIDEVFKLGFLAGGGKTIHEINNVKIVRNKQGNITGYQYDES